VAARRSGGSGEPGGLALETAGRIFAQARVAVLEEGRRKRAEGMKLAKIGRDLYRADDRYVVDAILGLCRHKHFERHNGKNRKQAGVPLVRSKRLIAAEDAEGQADRRDHDQGPTQNGLSTLLSLGARANARRGEARGGQKP
jgi:hypothetical protein